MYRILSLITVLWYITTSFQVSVNRSMLLVNKPSATQAAKAIDSLLFYSSSEIYMSQGDTYHLDLGQNYTALKITTLDSNPNHFNISTPAENLSIGTQISSDDIDIPTSFAIFSQPTNKLKIQGDVSQKVLIELFYAPKINEPKSGTKNKNDCSKPDMLSQAEWRAGLPLSEAGRSATVVKHCIIHHSAGSNTDTNYTNTVRNIYLLHTQSNGWDDIGYNVLVAPNGVIYSGRDSKNVADEDNILGAHFCAKNGGTMGICLLGNYESKAPSEAMQASLIKVLAWKLYKEKLSPFEVFPHPSATDTELGTVTMHRSGCATACPGDSTAALLPMIIDQVQNRLNLCNGSVSIVPKQAYRILIYPNPSRGRFYVMIEKQAQITHFILKNLLGKEMEHNTMASNGLITTSVPSGNYIIELYNAKGLVTVQKIIIE